MCIPPSLCGASSANCFPISPRTDLLNPSSVAFRPDVPRVGALFTCSRLPSPNHVRLTPCNVQPRSFKCRVHAPVGASACVTCPGRLFPGDQLARYSMPTSLRASLTRSISCVCRMSVSRSKTPHGRVSFPVYNGQVDGAFRYVGNSMYPAALHDLGHFVLDLHVLQRVLLRNTS